MPEEPDNYSVEGTETAEQEITVFEIPSEGMIRYGDHEFPAEEFRQHFIPQADYDRTRQTEKAEMQAQIEKNRADAMAQAHRLSNEYIQQQRNASAKTPNPQNTMSDMGRGATQRGYMTWEDILPLVEHFTNSMGAPNQQYEQAFRLLHNNNQNLQKQIQGLTGSVGSERMESWITEQAGRYPEVDEQHVRDLVAGWEASPGETDIRQSLGRTLSDRNEFARKRRSELNEKELEDRRRETAGLPGTGASPDLLSKLNVMASPEEITEVWFPNEGAD